MKHNKQAGDLYWSQISMWDFSDKEHVDVYSDTGMHYELICVTDIVSESQWKIRHIKVGELTDEQIGLLRPETGHNWTRVMGNIKDFKLKGRYNECTPNR